MLENLCTVTNNLAIVVADSLFSGNVARIVLEKYCLFYVPNTSSSSGLFVY